LRLARAFVTETEALLGAPRRGPMPRASARLLAMDDWGRRRRDSARVGDVAEAGGEAARVAGFLEGGEAVAGSEASPAASSFFLSVLRGGSLMRLACARWLFSRSAMMRCDCPSASASRAACAVQRQRRTHLGVACRVQAFVEGSSSKLMFLPRPGEVPGVCRGGGVADVLLGSGEGRRLHGRRGWFCACRSRCRRCGWWACSAAVGRG
jgi:hypothetical protein